MQILLHYLKINKIRSRDLQVTKIETKPEGEMFVSYFILFYFPLIKFFFSQTETERGKKKRSQSQTWLVSETTELGWRETGKRGQPRTLRRTLRPSDFFPQERMEKWVLIQFRHDRPPPPPLLRLRLRVRLSCSSIGSSDNGAKRFILCSCIQNFFWFREEKLKKRN